MRRFVNLILAFILLSTCAGCYWGGPDGEHGRGCCCWGPDRGGHGERDRGGHGEHDRGGGGRGEHEEQR